MSNSSVDGAGVSPIFNATDTTDIIIRSSDGALFHLRQAALEITTGKSLTDKCRLAGPSEVVELSEPELILDIVFQFTVPQRYPNMEDESFDTILAVAEAVEKYEVFAAMAICEMRLMDSVATFPVRTLVHGLQYNYPKMINQSAIVICRRPLTEVVTHLPLECVLPWARYYETWHTVFQSALQFISKMTLNTKGKCKHYTGGREIPHPSSLGVCKLCRSLIVTWVVALEAICNIDDLTSALAEPRLPGDSTPECPACKHESTSNKFVACTHMKYIVDDILKNIADIQPFTEYLI